MPEDATKVHDRPFKTALLLAKGKWQLNLEPWFMDGGNLSHGMEEWSGEKRRGEERRGEQRDREFN